MRHTPLTIAAFLIAGCQGTDAPREQARGAPDGPRGIFSATSPDAPAPSALSASQRIEDGNVCAEEECGLPDAASWFPQAGPMEDGQNGQGKAP